MYVNLNNIEFEYEANSPVLHDITLSMKQGDIVALLGDSGSGKSTLLRVIAGLEVQSKGSIEINSDVLASDNTFVPAEKRNVGMVFQHYALFPHMTVKQNIAFGCLAHNKTACSTQVEELLNLVHLPSKLNSYPHELSGGEQQRIALARSLAAKPDLLLLDEPFSNLDTELKSKLRQDIKRILQEANTTVLMVTHDEEDAMVLANKTYRIVNGRIQKDLK